MNNPAAQKAIVLVVDDSPVDRALVTSLIQKQHSFEIRQAENGAAALEAMAASLPDIVLTDLQMPVMDGLALVESIRRSYPFVPTVLMTAHGSEEIAFAALKAGAASYVNKRSLASRLAETLRDVLGVCQVWRQQLRLHECWRSTSFEFELENDASLIPVLVNHLQQYQAAVRAQDETALTQVGVALHEALRNAIHHGNLELDSSLREQNSDEYYRLAEQRRYEERYRDRRVFLHARESRGQSIYRIRDEGPGFAQDQLAYDPTAVMNLDRPSGRGLFLIRTFMDEVRFNERGNEITMVFKRSSDRPAADAAQHASA